MDVHVMLHAAATHAVSLWTDTALHRLVGLLSPCPRDDLLPGSTTTPTPTAFSGQSLHTVAVECVESSIHTAFAHFQRWQEQEEMQKPVPVSFSSAVDTEIQSPQATASAIIQSISVRVATDAMRRALDLVEEALHKRCVADVQPVESPTNSTIPLQPKVETQRLRKEEEQLAVSVGVGGGVNQEPTVSTDERHCSSSFVAAIQHDAASRFVTDLVDGVIHSHHHKPVHQPVVVQPEVVPKEQTPDRMAMTEDLRVENPAPVTAATTGTTTPPKARRPVSHDHPVSAAAAVKPPKPKTKKKMASSHDHQARPTHHREAARPAFDLGDGCGDDALPSSSSSSSPRLQKLEDYLAMHPIDRAKKTYHPKRLQQQQPHAPPATTAHEKPQHSNANGYEAEAESDAELDDGPLIQDTSSLRGSSSRDTRRLMLAPLKATTPAIPPPSKMAKAHEPKSISTSIIDRPDRLGLLNKPKKRSGFCQQCVFEGRSCKISDCLKHQKLMR